MILGELVHRMDRQMPFWLNYGDDNESDYWDVDSFVNRGCSNRWDLLSILNREVSYITIDGEGTLTIELEPFK